MRLKKKAAAEVRCRFGCEGPIGIFHVPQGCICWDDPVQALCQQHFVTAESTGPITLLADLTVRRVLANKVARKIARTTDRATLRAED